MNFLRKHSSQGKLIVVVVISVFFSSLITYLVTTSNIATPSRFGPIRNKDPSMPLIKPLLAYNNPELTASSPLKNSIKSSIASHLATNDVNVVSVYYRDLNTGHWFGINQDETFIPASLFKVPLMITYLKDAEKNPRLLSMRVLDNLDEDQNKNEIIKPLKTVTQGDTYTVDQLLSYMIEYSDNNATYLLFKNINKNTLQEVFADLNIQLPKDGVDTDFVTVENYSFFFRVLYNATYLNHEMSEKGLELLSKIDFEDGIRKNLPKGLTVADKFGEYFQINNGVASKYELHDCGIIYDPKHPYLLCVMTKGSSLDTLKKTIQDISKIAFGIVNSQ